MLNMVQVGDNMPLSDHLINADSSTQSLSVLLSAVERSFRTHTALEIAH